MQHQAISCFNVIATYIYYKNFKSVKFHCILKIKKSVKLQSIFKKNFNVDWKKKSERFQCKLWADNHKVIVAVQIKEKL